MPGDFILDSIFIIELIFLLFFDDITDFFAEGNVEVFFHFGFGFVLSKKKKVTGRFSSAYLTFSSIVLSFSLMLWW